MMDDTRTSHGDVRHCRDDAGLALVLLATAVSHLVYPGPVPLSSISQKKENKLHCITRT
jgi:hypothetical protein